MRKLIHSNFELDLSTFKISETEENSWFSENFFTRYSFPFEIDLTIDLDVAFEFISYYNTNPATYFNLIYVYDNQIEDAVFEIESFQDKIIGTLRFGLEQLPSFDKKLAELSLDNFDLASNTNIYDYANTIVTQSWPDVNFNFPQIHTDKIDTSDDVWIYFEKIINNRKNNLFIDNAADYSETQSITYNRNIIQPLPYFLHILQRGMIDAGFELSGNILSDELIQNATAYGDVDYYYKNELEVIETTIVSFTDFFYKSPNMIVNDYYHYKYKITQQLKGIGSYRFLALYSGCVVPNELNYYTVKVNGNLIYSGTVTDIAYDYPDEIVNVDVVFETTMRINIIEMEFSAAKSSVEAPNAFFYLINPMYYYDENITPITTVINENKIDLRQSVPDITFGDFVKVIKNWFNYDLRVEGNLAIMDKIEAEINYSNAIDLSFTEVKKPLRKFQQGMSFLLKFQDIDNKDFSFLPVFHNRDGFVNANYTTDEKTNTIEILALPLPKLNRVGVNTAYAFESNNAKVYLVPYTGLINGNNYSQPNDNYLLPVVHLNYWQKWFNFRINAQLFQWPFLAWNEKILDLKVKSKIFAYNNFHIIKTLNKTEIKPDLFEIEIETESLK